jgi:hypothetical protein
MTNRRTLADFLAALYRYFLDALTDDQAARDFARDWPSNNASACASLRRVGRAAWWFDREPAGPVDDSPFVLASIDPRSGELRFDAATAMDTRAAADATRFYPDGSPLG